MRKAIALYMILLLVLLCAACGSITAGDDGEKEEGALILPGGVSGGDEAAPEGETASGEQTKSTLYPPSIFVIEVSGGWRQEIAQGYFADYECEFYADKLDELDNQSASGQYTGVFWMKVELDTGEYLKEMLKNAPVNMQFDAGGEGVCDYINVTLMNGFERQSTSGDYTIPGSGNGTLTPSNDALAARGSFVTEATSAYLETRATGAAGETLEHQDSQMGSAEVDFVIHVEPDSDHKATERKVTMHLTSGDGMNGALEGVMRRLPGYSEDLKAYTSQGKRGEILDRHLQ